MARQLGSDASNNHQPKTTTGAFSSARDARCDEAIVLFICFFLFSRSVSYTAILNFFSIKKKKVKREEANSKNLASLLKRRERGGRGRGSSQKAQEPQEKKACVNVFASYLASLCVV